MGIEREKAIRELEGIEWNFEPIRRVNYNPPSNTTNCLSGPAVAADFDQYHLPSARTHNLALHGSGIAVGLELSITAGRATVSPGVAVDGDGQMIVLRKGGRFYFGESKTLGVGVAGVDLPPATNDGKPRLMSVTIEYADDPRADDPASPICGMIEPMPWVRVLTSDDLIKIPNNGRLIQLGDVEIGRESGARLLAGFRSKVWMNLQGVQLFRASSEGGKLYDICVGWLEASRSGISLITNDACFLPDVRLMPWGDGSEFPNSGEAAVVIVGPDNKKLLHIRVIDPFGNVVGDTDEGRIPAAVDISAMKKQILAWMPPHVLLGDEKVQVLRWVYSLLPSWDFQLNPSVSIKGRTTIKGNTQVVGKLSAGSIETQLLASDTITSTKMYFTIHHPLNPDRANLIHACIEGPELGVYYRGEAKLKDGEAMVELPAYFEALTLRQGRTVLLTPILEGDRPVGTLAASRVEQGRFRVRGAGPGDPGQAFFWEVKAIRADVDQLEVERPMNVPT